jgi:hypothetical protein
VTTVSSGQTLIIASGTTTSTIVTVSRGGLLLYSSGTALAPSLLSGASEGVGSGVTLSGASAAVSSGITLIPSRTG